jgi:maltose O-acetyltransferase
MNSSNHSLRRWKVVNWLQSSVFCPKTIRTKLLRFAGARIDETAMIAENVFLGGSNLVMGKGTFINVGSFLDGSECIVLGDHVRVGPYVKILTGTHRLRNSPLRRWPQDPVVSKPVRIKSGCWIGMAAIVLPGVTIAEGCVIGAGAVVTKNTSPHGFYTGVPAVRIKDLPIEEGMPEGW